MYIKQIIALRENNNLSKSEVARAIDIDIRNYTNYENEKRVLPYDVLIKLAKLYDVSTDYLLGLTNNPTHFRKGG